MNTPLQASWDSVVMLTASDWKVEPRSNRYHYATRFARSLPVFFVQPDDKVPLEEPTEIPGITLIHVGRKYHRGQLMPARLALKERGLTRPLLWIYNPNYKRLAEHFGEAIRVYHATEDYFSIPIYSSGRRGLNPFSARYSRLILQYRLIRALQSVDLVVSVTQGVGRQIREAGCYEGNLLVLENGCDYAFWTARPEPEQAGKADRIAIYQGGINKRLDTRLLAEVMRLLPDWEFHFCGPVDPSYDGWHVLRLQKNCRYLGYLDSESLRRALYKSAIGLIPLIQEPLFTRQSLPLKAYEYAACGLPVVSIPIDSLAPHREVFRFAATAEEFATGIVHEGRTRYDNKAVAARHEAARAQSYDLRFEELTGQLRNLQRARRAVSVRALTRMLALFSAACLLLPFWVLNGIWRRIGGHRWSARMTQAQRRGK